jgi:hypothetical protein
LYYNSLLSEADAWDLLEEKCFKNTLDYAGFPFLFRINSNIATDRPKPLENVELFKFLISILTNVGRCTCEVKCRIAMAKAAFNEKSTLFTSTLDLELRKKLVKCYIWCIALYGAENWTL